LSIWNAKESSAPSCPFYHYYHLLATTVCVSRSLSFFTKLSQSLSCKAKKSQSPDLFLSMMTEHNRVSMSHARIWITYWWSLSLAIQKVKMSWDCKGKCYSPLLTNSDWINHSPPLFILSHKYCRADQSPSLSILFQKFISLIQPCSSNWSGTIQSPYFLHTKPTTHKISHFNKNSHFAQRDMDTVLFKLAHDRTGFDIHKGIQEF